MTEEPKTERGRALAERARPLLIVVAAVVAAVLGLGWWRGPQPEMKPPPTAMARAAEALLRETEAFLAGRSSGDAEAPTDGRWYLTLYPVDGSDALTVQCQGPTRTWAEPLRPRWPGRLQADRAIAEPPSARAGPRGIGLDVGLDGWIERSGTVHLPVAFLLDGYRRPELAEFMAAHPGEPLRTYTWVPGPEGPLRLLRLSVDPGPLGPAELRRRIDLGADYLARHLRRDDRYDYEWDARHGRPLGGYNLLRHAGTTYSLFQVYAQTGRERHYRAAKRALRYLRRQRRFAAGDRSRCFEVEGDKVKLGGAGLTLLALVEQAKARPTDADWPWMHCLAEHILSQTDEDGDMASYYAEPGRYAASGRRSAYYPGEATLGLAELYGIDPDPRWLDCARRAARFMAMQRWHALGIRIYVPADAWLIQALAVLDEHAPDPALLDYAFVIGEVFAREQLWGSGVAEDLQGGAVQAEFPSVVTAGSRGEGLAAAAHLERRHRPGESVFRERLEASCRYALRNQYTDPILLALTRPRSARGGFRSSPASPVIRIDGVQPNLSALIGLLELQEAEP